LTVSQRSLCSFLIPVFLLTLPIAAEDHSTLPDAPSAAVSSASGSTAQDAPAPDPGPRPVHASNTSSYRSSKWYGVVDPGENVPPLDSKDKMLFWLHEEISPVGWFPVVYSAGWEHIFNEDPKYGTDSAAFGERLGAAALRVSSYRFFSDSLLPTVLHEDPRYFRKAYGSVVSRGLYSAAQSVVARKDDGSTGVSFASILGHLAGSALTATYYPAPSVKTSVVMETWGWSMAGDAGGNLFLEFWPDVRDAVFHRHRHPALTTP
jgi:hypothetical protein